MKLEGKLNMKVSYNEAALIQTLLEKYQAKPMKACYYETTKYYLCPRCDKIISGSSNYCERCGQRPDNKNIAF